MAFPANGIEVVLNYTLANGGTAANVFHMIDSPAGHAPTQANVDAIANQLGTYWDTASGGVGPLKRDFNNHTVLQSVVATARGLVPQLQATKSVGTAGSLTGVPLPLECATVLSWYTGFPGKSYRGRSYIPGPDPEMIGTDGLLTTADANNIKADWEKFMQVANAATSTHLVGIYSRTLGVITVLSTQVPIVRRTIHHQSRRNA